MSPPARDQVHRIAAHQYLEQGHKPVGWVIINGTKAAVSMKGCHYAGYSITHAEIDRWNWRWQAGLAMCEASQRWAADFDGGKKRVEQFHEDHLVPRTAIQLSGRPGGCHLVFQGTDGSPWPRDGAWSKDWPDVQVRSNGFIAAAPSIHPNGRQYRWLDDHPPVGPGPWLLGMRPEREPRHLAGGGPARPGGPDGDLAWAAGHGIPFGWQDTEIHRLACANVRSMNHQELAGLLWQAVCRSDQNPLSPWRPEDVAAKVRRAAEFIASEDAKVAGFARWMERARGSSEPGSQQLVEQWQARQAAEGWS